MEKETLEKAAENYSKKSSASVFQEAHKRDFIEGAKWQQEQDNDMYSEEKVKDIVEKTIEKFYKHFYTLTKAEMKEKWFEQFKKK